MSDAFDNEEMKEILQDFLTEAEEMLEGLDTYFVQLESRPDDRTLLNEIFRTAHSIKGSAGFIGLNRIVEVAHHAENVLNQLRQGQMRAEPLVIDIILEAMDALKLLVREVRTGTPADVDIDALSQKLDLLMQWGEDVQSESAQEQQEQEGEGAREHPEETVGKTAPETPVPSETTLLPEAFQVEDEELAAGQTEAETGAGKPVPAREPVPPSRSLSPKVDSPPPSASEGPSAGAGESDQTIRVETSRLDNVMNLVGELVLGRNRLVRLSGDQSGLQDVQQQLKEISEAVAQLSRVTTDLQLAVIKTRMQPIRKVLGKFPRMVRDLSRKMGKEVRLELSGEETELDKSVIEEIGDPLVHIIRNAIDHGLESPEERQASGKPAEGVVRIGAYQEGNSIVIEVSDDGKGINVERVKQKAIERRLISGADADRMSEGELVNLIFLPGFSTAEKITDVSGRGVGMDVVRTNINKINGSVEVRTTPGAGSTFIIRLPLTIAIIQALMVTIGAEVYAIPLQTVVETVKITREEVKTLSGSDVLNLRDQVLPLLRLRDEFKVPDTDPADPSRCYVVVVQLGSRLLGLVVDRLPYQEEVVIKSMGPLLSGIRGMAGATITGDGKVVLILDVAEILQDIQLRQQSGAVQTGYQTAMNRT
ncbi:MAG: putative signal transduction histidine kinase (CheA) [Leptospirillum rubarum]|jgi:two-component system chemotaxis sensor kinase CheA|nr:MAG: putative signal transduction histidine kinase (CheA) [Leptospirillum rubarum]